MKTYEFAYFYHSSQRVSLGHYNEMGGQMGAARPYNNAKRFYYWPGMFDWICAITANSLTCQNNKPKPKHRKEVPLEKWQNETVQFRRIHIDHKGPLTLLVTGIFIVF